MLPIDNDLLKYLKKHEERFKTITLGKEQKQENSNGISLEQLQSIIDNAKPFHW